MELRKISSDEDTIAAIATPMGKAGIGIIRISGSSAEGIAKRIFSPQKPIKKFESHRLYLGYLTDPDSGDTIDEVLLSIMYSPRSYTREDVVEINSHSGYFLLSKLLEIILKQGARLARPGEFTLRAFLNGRIDLTQAEAVMNLINARSERGLLLSTRQIRGVFREKVASLRKKVVDYLAQLEAAIDYPDEMSEILSTEGIVDFLPNDIIQPIEELIAAHAAKRIWVDGIETVIIGRVNVGKSSLLNRLSHDEKAIVTPIPGTTRDVIESFVTIKGIPFHLLDTAGFREVKDDVERIGVDIAEQKLNDADCLLVVMDQSSSLTRGDYDLILKAKGKRAIVVFNKIDLPAALDETSLAHDFPTVRISALTGEGINDLEEQMARSAMEGEMDLCSTAVVPNLRQQKALKEASDFFRDADSALKQGKPMEIVAAELKGGLEALAEITGESASQEEVLESIFSRFCLGK